MYMIRANEGIKSGKDEIGVRHFVNVMRPAMGMAADGKGRPGSAAACLNAFGT
jgi:deazaflavin-dependent oxidoreductase (nitroreductase family)